MISKIKKLIKGFNIFIMGIGYILLILVLYAIIFGDISFDQSILVLN